MILTETKKWMGWLLLLKYFISVNDEGFILLYQKISSVVAKACAKNKLKFKKKGVYNRKSEVICRPTEI